MVGGHHNTMNCIRKVETTVLVITGFINSWENGVLKEKINMSGKVIALKVNSGVIGTY